MQKTAMLVALLAAYYGPHVIAQTEQVPVISSPGSGEHVEEISAVCPTFSWGAVPGTSVYEIKVYSVSAEGILEEEVIGHDIAGGATAWTPPIDRCLMRGKTYAWSVGAVRGSGVLWSEPVVFRVAAGATEAEFRDALQVVEHYLVASRTDREGSDRKTSRRPKVSKARESEARRKPARSSALANGVPFRIDGVGNVAAATFTGSGAGLTSVNAETLDGLDSLEFLRTTGGTISGDLTVQGGLTASGTVSAPALTLGGEALQTVTEPTVYTPAFLTCGSNAESNSAQWASLASGTFRITLEAVGYDVSVNFVGVTDMTGVAARIQSAVNSVTGGAETVVWNTNHFSITSDDTTAGSSISPLDPHSGAAPIDISGAGVSDWMACDGGNGVANAANINLPFYSSYLVRLDTAGKINASFLRFPGTPIASTSLASICTGPGFWQATFKPPADATYGLVYAQGAFGAAGQSCGLNGVLINHPASNLNCSDTGNINQAVRFNLSWGSCDGSYLLGATSIFGTVLWFR